MNRENDYLGGLLRHYVSGRQGDEDYLRPQIDLFDGEIQGFQVGDRIRFSDEAYEQFRGKEARVAGFDSDFNIWTQMDGESGYSRTPREFAHRAFTLVRREEVSDK